MAISLERGKPPPCCSNSGRECRYHLEILRSATLYCILQSRRRIDCLTDRLRLYYSVNALPSPCHRSLRRSFCWPDGRLTLPDSPAFDRYHRCYLKSAIGRPYGLCRLLCLRLPGNVTTR